MIGAKPRTISGEAGFTGAALRFEKENISVSFTDDKGESKFSFNIKTKER